MPGRVIALTSDLIFSSKISAAGTAAGVMLTIVRSLPTLQAHLSDSPRLLLVDLDIADVDPIAAITLARGRPQPPKIIAFGSHVEAEKLTLARAVGAEVIPRSVFAKNLDELLAGES